MTLAIYNHIPFCRQKCNYCDFVSYAGKEELIDKYVDALIAEIYRSAISYQSSAAINQPTTVFFGGGTPTLLKPDHFKNIFDSLIRNWTLDIGYSEISVESNPGTANLAKLKALRELGINRLSIGCQSFNDKHLKTLGRIHSAKQAIQFIKDARTAGFDNINLDLMFALPNQTLEEWQEDLSMALSLEPEHLSTYNLQLEEGTNLYKVITNYQIPIPNKDGEVSEGLRLQLPTEDIELAMYEYTIETLTKNGFKHYEISNFAKQGFECKHNINYWLNGNYHGFGAGAHSYMNGQRWANVNCIEEYISRLTSFDMPPPIKGKKTRGGDALFLGLRLLDGLPKRKFINFEKEALELISQGLLEESGTNYRLTHRGLLLGNLVFEKFV
jgi:oxygen-independent coproporphyrinogen-3 oxidase